MTDHKTYEIAGQKFYQTELSCGQTATLTDLVGDLNIDFSSGLKMFTALLRRVPELAAVALIPESMDKVQFEEALDRPGFLEKRIAFFKPHLGVIKGGLVIKDFLSCNDPLLLLEIVNHVMALMEQLNDKLPENNSMNLSPLSVGETPLSGTVSKPLPMATSSPT